MKTVVKRAIRNEKGYVLITVLILLVVGGLILTPLLGLMSTGLLAGKVYEKKMDEYYAADAGVEDAIWKIMNEAIPPESWDPCDDRPDWDLYKYPKLLIVGNKSVAVVVYRYDWDPTLCGENLTYQILSTAATDDGGGTAAIDSSTTVEAYIEPTVFDLLSGALVSSGNIAFHKDCTVTGDVYYVGDITGKDYTHTDGEEIQIPADVFPTQAENEAFADELEEEAREGGTYNGTDGNMDISESGDLGPIYVPGNLDISKEVTINLKGVVYVKGHISCDKTLTITGNGSIIAEDYIYLSKLADYTVTGDSIIMSLNSDITLKKSDPDDVLSINALIYAPNGTISFDKDMTVAGSVIGAGIETDKDGSFTYISKGSSFGLFDPVIYGAKIKTYTINPPESY
jgi:hypothetical protein